MGAEAFPELGPRVEAHLERFVAEGEIDAMAVAVGVRGQSVGAWYAGQARPGRAAGPDTLWPLASISKLYTAAAVMALVEEGRLTLGTRVVRVLPEFAGDGREAITLRHLLTHTSGILYESPRMVERLRARTPIAELLDEIREHPLLFAPGTRHSYTDLGLALAGHLAATVAGVSFPELVHTRVFEPAGLRETCLLPEPADEDRIAYVTGVQAEGSNGAMYNSNYARALAHPAFGVIASVNDLLRFGLLFAPGGTQRLLSDASVRAMTTNQLPAGVVSLDVATGRERPIGWGLGFAIHDGREGYVAGGDLLPPGSFEHGGASGCLLAIDPLNDVVLAIVGNRHAATGRERFTFRQASTANVVLAALTRRT